MRRVANWFQEGFYRLLGMLSALNFGLLQTGMGAVLRWQVMILLLLGILLSANSGWQAFLCYDPPLRRIHELVETLQPPVRCAQVLGWTHKDTGYELILERESPPDLLARRNVLQSYYLLLDHDDGWGILVASAPLPQQYDPELTLVTGRLTKMPSELRIEVDRDDWEQHGITILDRVLEDVEQRLPVRELIILILCISSLAFLLLSPRFDYVIFRPEPANTPDLPADQVGPLSEVDLRLTASFPLTRTRRRLRFIETPGRIQPDEEGWKIQVYHKGEGCLLSVPLPAESIEQTIPGRVYFGRRPRWGLWLVYRDPQGIRRRLCFSFEQRAQSWAMYEMLVRWADQGQAPSTPREDVN